MGPSLVNFFGFLNYVMFHRDKNVQVFLRDLAAILKMLIRSGYEKN